MALRASSKSISLLNDQLPGKEETESRHHDRGPPELKKDPCIYNRGAREPNNTRLAKKHLQEVALDRLFRRYDPARRAESLELACPGSAGWPALPDSEKPNPNEESAIPGDDPIKFAPKKHCLRTPDGMPFFKCLRKCMEDNGCW